MRSMLIAACVLAQAAVLLSMVYGRETIIANGTRITLATAPIDPRDPFRGDFVRLRYGLNALSYAPATWIPANEMPRKGDLIYAVLQERLDGLHDVNHFTNKRPDTASDTVFLRGRLRTDHWGSGLNRVDVGFGIEQLFVEQGSGLAIEERQGVRGGLQTAMQVEVALGRGGTTVLTGYDWSPLSIGIELSPDFALNRQEGTSDIADTPTQDAPPLTLTVVNTANETVTLNNPGEDCGFRLEAVGHRTSSQYTEPDDVCEASALKALLLQPGDSLVIPVDLASPRWHMTLTVDGQQQTGDVRSFQDHGEWFRLVYRSASHTEFTDSLDRLDSSDSSGSSPSAESSASFWRGELISQAFNALGQFD